MERIRDQAVSEPERRELPPPAKVATPRDRREANVIFALAILFVGVVSVFLLSGAGQLLTARSPAAVTHAPQTSGTSRAMPAPLRQFPMPDANADLMQPALDAQGNVWFGEMGTNRLGRLDPRTGKVTHWTPPGGQFGIMDIAEGPDGAIWFTEQAANYIGRFDPAAATFRTFPLAGANGHAAAPQDLVFDARGMLWFTEVSAGAIARLYPATGALHTWPVPPASAGAPVYPYGIALGRGDAVWFSELSGGTLGRLAPTTGQFKLYQAPTHDAQIFSLAAGPDGTLWFSELQYGRIGRLNPDTGAIKEYAVPTTFSSTPNVYDLAVARDGTVWVAAMGQNAIARFAPDSEAFTLFTLPGADSLPYGLVLDGAGRVWFTAERNPTNYIGLLDANAANE